MNANEDILLNKRNYQVRAQSAEDIHIKLRRARIS